MELPPGVKYLARTLPSALLPSAATYLVLSHIPSLDLPLWLRILATLRCVARWGKGGQYLPWTSAAQSRQPLAAPALPVEDAARWRLKP